MLLGAVVLLAGCGGGASAPADQTVQGDGFSFQAPLTWVVTRETNAVAAAPGAVDRLEVLRFTLERAYHASLLARTTRELDAVVARLAAQLSGRVVERSTARVAGAPAPYYRLDYPRGKTLEIAFVLRGTNEYELLCRRRTTEPVTDCKLLFSSFALLNR